MDFRSKDQLAGAHLRRYIGNIFSSSFRAPAPPEKIKVEFLLAISGSRNPEGGGGASMSAGLIHGITEAGPWWGGGGAEIISVLCPLYTSGVATVPEGAHTSLLLLLPPSSEHCWGAGGIHQVCTYKFYSSFNFS